MSILFAYHPAFLEHDAGPGHPEYPARVEAMVCRSCGERYDDLRTMRFLEEAARKLQGKELEVRQVGRVMEAI